MSTDNDSNRNADTLFIATDADDYRMTVRHMVALPPLLRVKNADVNGDFIAVDLHPLEVLALRDTLNTWLDSHYPAQETAK